MRYKPKSSAALHIALGGLPAKLPVKVDADIEVSAKTVGELRELTAWPENLAITTPQDAYTDSAVRVSKVSIATRHRRSRSAVCYQFDAGAPGVNCCAVTEGSSSGKKRPLRARRSSLRLHHSPFCTVANSMAATMRAARSPFHHW
jgi:hypothetical protein